MQDKTVVVTGCSSGIGLAAARYLHTHGWKVAPTARKDADLDRLHKEGYRPVHLDVAMPGSVDQASSEILELFNGTVGAVVNNAGMGQPGAIEDLSREALRYQFEVNVLGLQDLTNRFIPTFRRQGYGRIVNISSVLGLVSLPFMGAYSATKFALEALSDALRMELHGSGITVSLVEPGPIRTRFGENAVTYGKKYLNFESSRFSHGYKRHMHSEPPGKGRDEDRFTLGPETVAQKIYHALSSSRPYRRYPVTVPAYIGMFIRRAAPAALIDHIMYKHQVNRHR